MRTWPAGSVHCPHPPVQTRVADLGMALVPGWDSGGPGSRARRDEVSPIAELGPQAWGGASPHFRADGGWTGDMLGATHIPHPATDLSLGE